MSNMEKKRHRIAPLRDELVERLQEYVADNSLHGTQLPRETDLAVQFGVSRKTLRAALDVLETQQLIRRIHGRGTFCNDAAINARNRIIYFPIPCSDYMIKSGAGSANNIKVVYTELMRACTGLHCGIVTLPFSRTNIIDDVDYETLDQIEPGSLVFLLGMWYRYGFHFFAERKCRVVFLYDQNFAAHYPDDDNYLPYINQWFKFRTDSGSRTRIAVQELFRRRCKRPLVIGTSLHAVTSTFLNGFSEGGGKLVWEMPPFQTMEEFRFSLQKAYKETQFDGLLMSIPSEFNPDLRYSLAHYLGLPETVEIILLESSDFCNLIHPRITQVTYDYRQICEDAVKVLRQFGMPDGRERMYSARLLIPAED